ncbi:MAG: hypothetical protein V4683_19040, partial [Bacteroidota bacterium]
MIFNLPYICFAFTKTAIKVKILSRKTKMKESIYIYSKFAETEKNALISFFGVENEVFFHDTVPENIQFETFKKCQYCLGNIPISWCLSAQNLKWLQLHSAGIDPYNTLVNPSFIITNLRGYFAESVAETT